MNKKWDKRWMQMAEVVSWWSKDPSTKVSAIAVKDKRLIATGYNGFPRGIADTHTRLNNREEKYKYVVHAEMNCIYNATYNGISLKDSTIYIYGLPSCSECAKGLIQVGVKRVVYKADKEIPEQWLKSNELTIDLFTEADVSYERF